MSKIKSDVECFSKLNSENIEILYALGELEKNGRDIEDTRIKNTQR